MKVQLIKPYNLSDHIQPSLGLGYLATVLRPNHEVRITDCIKERLKVDSLLDKIRDYKPDLVGFQCYTFDLKFVREALAECKKINKNIIAVIGGPHPSAVPEESFEYFGDVLDYLFVGEAERGLPLLLNHIEDDSVLDLSEIPGLAWRENSKVRINPQIFLEDLDSLGMPAWDLIRPEEYPESQHGAFFKKFPIAPLMLTRGCPFYCTFCAGNKVSGKKIRKHSVSFMLKEIEYLYNTRHIREFHIVDDNFTFDINYAKDFLRKLIDLRLDISLATPNGVRLDMLDEELLGLMKKSGVYLISLGIESGSDRILGLMRKGTNIKKIRESINMINKFNIEVAGFFIIGFPGEKKEDIERTISFSLNLDLVRANYFTYLPFPGTDSYKDLLYKGELKNINWDKFYFMNASYAPEGLSNKQLKSFQRIAFLKFYLRPLILLKNIKEIKSFRHFKFLLKRFFHWLIMN